MKFQVLSFDPGGTSGVAWAAFDSDNNIVDSAQWQIEYGEHHVEISATLDNFKNARKDFGSLHIVSESFEYRNDSRDGLVLVSKEYIGVMKLWCKLNNHEYHEQTAGEGKNFANQKKLELLDMYTEGYPNRHGNEAASHLCYYVVSRLKRGDKIKDKWKSLLQT